MPPMLRLGRVQVSARPASKRVKGKCQVLDQNGKLCRKDSVRLIQYHGDGELYAWKEPSISWVAVRMCVEHAEVIVPARERRRK